MHPLRNSIRKQQNKCQFLINAVDLGAETLPITCASSDGRRNTPLIDWFHNSLQREPISQAVLNYI